jgi:16S rRNA (guanine966-N2)-methyltransferase
MRPDMIAPPVKKEIHRGEITQPRLQRKHSTMPEGRARGTHAVTMPRIIAGEFRSRRLLAPEDDETSRPYLDRVKESVFNLLRGWFEGARVLDLFAGVGTVGLEAVSRGAASAVLVEKNPKHFELLKKNIETLQCGDRAVAVLADALSPTVLQRASQPVDVVFIDPPYAMMEDDRLRRKVLEQCARCREIMAEKSFLVLRSPLGPEEAELAVDGFEGPEVHKYSQQMWVLLYAPAVSA